MEARRETTTEIAVITIAGSDLDSAAADEVRRDTSARLVVDLTSVTHVDSAGLGALLARVRRARADGGDVKLCGLRATIRRLLVRVGLAELFEIHATADEAMRSFEGYNPS